MDNEFRIRITIRTINGFEPLCDFYIGNNKSLALAIIDQLEGSDEVKEHDILQLDFLEIVQGLPLNMKIKYCTLSQLTRNCGLITKEVFKYRNLIE
ncbi:MAG: hypothetical protein JST75_09015 [Bacteroidetes bacterium]|nr:hypothetical protein [Bacteroidota bacterium]